VARFPLLPTAPDHGTAPAGGAELDRRIREDGAAIVMLGGTLETRPFAAAEHYKNNFARQGLVPNARLSPVEKTCDPT
jgi:hypothetical protein